MSVTSQLRAVGLLILQDLQEPMLSPLKSGTAIYIPHCQQAHIQQHNLAPTSYTAIIEVSLGPRFIPSWR